MCERWSGLHLLAVPLEWPDSALEYQSREDSLTAVLLNLNRHHNPVTVGVKSPSTTRYNRFI